ncbi:MAG: hypothetical protein LBK99_04910 [Opitutaceae bacterium]|jgi:hypothetical protein|nr:hypothetical protein [Opitutaceae bacterium]
MNPKPWREIAEPHSDVREGKFQQAEFAADLSRVLKENELLISEWAPIHLAKVLKDWFWEDDAKDTSPDSGQAAVRRSGGRGGAAVHPAPRREGADRRRNSGRIPDRLRRWPSARGQGG